MITGFLEIMIVCKSELTVDVGSKADSLVAGTTVL